MIQFRPSPMNVHHAEPIEPIILTLNRSYHKMKQGTNTFVLVPPPFTQFYLTSSFTLAALPTRPRK